jgi:hypothetical protein
MSEAKETMNERLARLTAEESPKRTITQTDRVIGFRRIGDNVSLWLVDIRTSGVRRIEVTAESIESLVGLEMALDAVKLK